MSRAQRNPLSVYAAPRWVSLSSTHPTFSRLIRWPHVASNLDAAFALDHRDVIPTLQVQSKLRAIAEIAGEADGRIGGDRTPAVQNVGDTTGRLADIKRNAVGAQFPRV